MRFASSLSLAALALSLAQSAAAQQQDTGPDVVTPAPQVDEDENTITVFAQRLWKAVDAPEPPLLELGEEDIAAYGAGSIAELLAAIAPQVSSGRGRGDGGGMPVILVNGVRIASPRELGSYPPEAIQKVEVFPEETAQRYGYSPDQRVVNFILKDDFASREIELEYGQPWDGGFSTQEAEATYLKIDGPARLNLNLEWSNSSVLTEAERKVTLAPSPTLPGDPDPARFRSLVSDTAGLEATGNWTRRLSDAGDTFTLNATYKRDDALRLQGLDTVLLTAPSGASALRTLNADDPLRVDSRTSTYALAGALNLALGDWQVTGTAEARRLDTNSRIERRLDLSALQAAAAAGTLALDAPLGPFADAGADIARTRTTGLTTLVTARGRPLELPAGDVSVTLDTGFNWNRIESRDTRGGPEALALTRGNLSGGVNLAIPLTSRRYDVLDAVGDVSVNLSAGVDHLSDFGTLVDWTAGVTWGITDKLALTATHIARESAPTLTQLGDAEIATPNVPVFDFATGQTALVTVVSGGNPFLPAQDQRDWKLGLTWELPVLERSNLSIDYIRNHSSDVAAGFPVLTPAIEAAYPERITRDAAGRLLRIDQRPVSFAEQDVERLQFGLNLSGGIGSPPEGRGGPPSAPSPAAARPPPGGAPGGVGVTGSGQMPPANLSPGERMDAGRFMAMRQLLCGESGAEVALKLARGEAVTGPEGELVNLPPMLLERLRAGGEPDPALVEQVRTQICGAQVPAGTAGASAPAQPAAAPAGRAGGGGGGGGGVRFMGPGGPGAGRWFVNLTYTLELDNRVLVAPQGPLLDLLDGDALTGGGQARHSATARAGVFHKGFGSIMSAEYTGASRIEGTGLPGSTGLAFDDLFTLNWRLFVDLKAQKRVVEAAPWLDGVRVSLALDNLFDARRRVTDSSGAVPLRYRPFLLDPVGRRVEFELRKLF